MKKSRAVWIEKNSHPDTQLAQLNVLNQFRFCDFLDGYECFRYDIRTLISVSN